MLVLNGRKKYITQKKHAEKYGGKLAVTDSRNYNYIRNFFYRNKWRLMKRDKHINKPVHRGVNPRGKLSECQGDCDKDSDCRGNNICYQKSYSRSRSYLRVPGCKTTRFRNVRGANKADDFCINPKKTELRLKYYSIFPNCSNIRCYSNIRLKDMKKM